MADEVRLIDANDYRKRRCRTCINRVQCDNGGNLCFDIMVLNTCPTIEAQPVKHEIIELLNECRETIFGATYTSGEEYTHAITLCDKISAVIGEGKQ